MEVVTKCSVDIPSWAIAYMENDDCSGITEEEKKTVDNYLKSMKDEGYENFEVTDDVNEFNSHPEFGLAGATTKVIFIRLENSN